MKPAAPHFLKKQWREAKGTHFVVYDDGDKLWVDLSKERWKSWYGLTFFMCIVWLGVLCWLMAALATAIDCVWEIDPVVIGILLLAIGTSAQMSANETAASTPSSSYIEESWTAAAVPMIAVAALAAPSVAAAPSADDWSIAWSAAGTGAADGGSAGHGHWGFPPHDGHGAPVPGHVSGGWALG